MLRLTLSQWIKGTLTKEKVIVKMEKDKINFTKTDYIHTVSSFWTVDDPVFIHSELYSTRSLVLFKPLNLLSQSPTANT
jgi:hypothetical protein